MSNIEVFALNKDAHSFIMTDLYFINRMLPLLIMIFENLLLFAGYAHIVVLTDTQTQTHTQIYIYIYILTLRGSMQMVLLRNT
jgi:hypothetical protein